jgi:hypothetical protein
MSCLENLRASRKDKEYFVTLRFYSDHYKNVDILSDLLIDDAMWGKIVTTDKDIINAESLISIRNFLEILGIKIEFNILMIQ